MSTPVSSILLFVLAAALGAVGQFLYREGAASLAFGFKALLFNASMWAGIACYVAVMVLFVAAYRIGGSLAVLYPVYASTFIFGAFIAAYTEGGRISAVNVAGMVLLVAGMALLGAGHRKSSRADATTRAAHAAAAPGDPVSHPPAPGASSLRLSTATRQ